ncbi:MAG: hypothetical protein MUO57_07890 [Anaerolineales bacterium]|nr:hypothetical protein [Anaerolineales bacterium]
MTKILKFAFLIILTILLIGCGTATDQDTGSDEWKTITNEQFGYSFEVPAFCFEGPLPGDCKQSPPEERPEECLCHVDGTDPEFVGFQKFTVTSEETSLATIWIMSPDTRAYSPAEGTDLISFIQQEWSEMDLGELPAEPNMDLDGLPAVSLSIAQSQGGAAAQEVFFIKGDKLFKITMIDNLVESNVELYEHFLDSFTVSK